MRRDQDKTLATRAPASPFRRISDRLKSSWRRSRRAALLALLIGATSISNVGCSVFDRIKDGPHDTTASYHDDYAMRIEYPEVQQCASAPAEAATQATAPLALEDPSKIPTLELTLEEAIQLSVQQSPVLRSIGGTVITNPDGTTTTFDPALAHANPLTGVEAALSDFDAQFTQELFWSNADQPQNLASNNVVTQFTPNTLQETYGTYNAELSKQTAQGASFALRHSVNYNYSNRPTRAFRSDFIGFLEAEYRQPLMQGAGTTFNRIAGPNSQIGQYNGVLIARVNEDVALADFEAAVISLVADVEQAYWELSAAYRVLEANVKGRDSALQTFQYQQVRLEAGAGRSDEEAQAQSQYYQFRAQVEAALASTDGLYTREQRLRYLIGLPASDGRLLKPTTTPTDVRVVFDWESALGQALSRRVEVRRQRFNLKKREMELTAARLNRRPRLDFLGQYRFRGLGDHLIGGSDKEAFDSLYGNITDGNYQEWQAGLEMQFPVGLRAASAAVAHANLNLRRERAVLAETELRISHDLADAGRQIMLTHQLLETNYNRYLADQRQVDVLRRRYRDGTDNINFLLQAQRQVVTSEADFYRALAAYNLAIRDFHRQKGSLLAYNQVQLTEGQWAAGAYQDAHELGRHLTPRLNPSDVEMPAPLTSGAFDPSAPQMQSFMNAPATDAMLESSPQPVESPQPATAAEDAPSA
ncbi:outer membrane efflux protein [Rhodopirellula maiorica SM1]|uniref:Outer membrane efflux protein n=1 Tax=Rhodopirellula maiorica SM1 TaxID=1265738 RepID=M5S490_9BACT|nr:TolC family protein [Rhodopirellula maiorica]EMI21009.1 outer membrane efflux protein [Rhodopirellula maiorica SM1]